MTAADAIGGIVRFIASLLARKSAPALPVVFSDAPAKPVVAVPMPVVVNGARKASAKCIALIKSFESCRLTAYPDPKTGGAPFTIGWGATGFGVGPGIVWTQAQADIRLAIDIAERETIVSRYVTHPTTQGQYDAFVSLIYNIGAGTKDKSGIIRLKDGSPSTLLRMFNSGDIAGCEAQWELWCSPGSNVENGLKRRRAAELKLFRGES